MWPEQQEERCDSSLGWGRLWEEQVWDWGADSQEFDGRCRVTSRHTNGNVTKAVAYQNLELIGEKLTLDFGVIS